MTWIQRVKAKQSFKQKARAEAAIEYQKRKVAMVSNNEPVRKKVSK